MPWRRCSICRCATRSSSSSRSCRMVSSDARLMVDTCACPPRAVPGVNEMRNCVTTLILVAVCSVAPRAQDAKATHGQQVYTDQKCGLCHSIGDKGNKKGPLDGVAAKLKPAEIREWMTDAKGMTAKTKATRKPEMKAYSLPKEDVDALVAYLETLKK